MDNDLDALKAEWQQKQLDLRSAYVESDDGLCLDDIQFISGIDISYAKEEANKGCVSLVVLDLKNDFECVHSSSTFIEDISIPYMAGYLAFREIDYLFEAQQKLKDAINNSQGKLRYPDLFFIDGNGKLHPRRMGLATHFGISIDHPTVGIAKNPYWVQPGVFENEEEKNAMKESHRREIEQKLVHSGDWFPISDRKNPNDVLGAAVKSTKDAKNPIYVSVGHKITLQLAIQIVLKCCKYRVPEPIRKADFVSREFLRGLSLM